MEKSKIYDFHSSGTTVLIYIITKYNIIEISLGDSGSFVFIQKEDGIYQVHQNLKHNFESKHEIQRIKEMGTGAQFVQQIIKGEREGPVRIWDRQLVKPGLAVSRTLGDIYAHSIGVSTNIGKLIRVQLNRKKRQSLYHSYRLGWPD
jgi:hypothetical protein